MYISAFINWNEVNGFRRVELEMRCFVQMGHTTHCTVPIDWIEASAHEICTSVQNLYAWASIIIVMKLNVKYLYDIRLYM